MDMKRVYLFREGNAGMRDLLGGKGANLAEMSNIGLPVPPGFTITTEVCNEYYEKGRKLPDGLMDAARDAIKDVEKQMGRTLGGATKPLLVSVRSGAKFSMPGMLIAAPERTETSSGLLLSPNFLPSSFSMIAMFFFTSSSRPAGSLRLFS